MEDKHIGRVQGVGFNVQPPVGVQLVETARGERKGGAVTVVARNSDLTDLQEEVGMSVAKLVDKRSLHKAKMRQGAGISKEALQRIEDYFDKLPDAPQDEKLLELVERLETVEKSLDKSGEAHAGTTVDDVMQALSGADRSARRQYMLLQGARIHFEAMGAHPDLVSVLDQVENSFDSSGIAAEVRADFAMLALAKEVAPSMGVPAEALCDKYREMLMTGKNLGQIFYALADLQKRLKLGTVVDLFMKAAGNDLAATSRKTDKVFLASLLKWLGVLKTMRSTFDACDELLDTTQRICPDFGRRLKETAHNKLIGELLSFCSRQMTSLEDVRSLIKPFEDENTTPRSRVVFYNGLIDVHRKMPDLAIFSNQARLQQANNLLEHSGMMVEAEERMQGE